VTAPARDALDLDAVDMAAIEVRGGLHHETACELYRVVPPHDCDCEAQRPTRALDTLVARVRELEADAARYRWLQERYHGADFDYDTAQPRCSVLTFRIADDARVSANLDDTIDAARGAA